MINDWETYTYNSETPGNNSRNFTPNTYCLSCDLRLYMVWKEIFWLYSCRYIRLDGLEPMFPVCKQENILQITWPLGIDQFVVQIGITLLHTVSNLVTELILFILVVEECVDTMLRIIDVIEADED